MQRETVDRVASTPSAELDRLVADRRLTGYTVEVDTSYLQATRPTLTYRMYAGCAVSVRNLDVFCAAMNGIGAELQASRLTGTTAVPDGLVRTDQVCVRAGFEDDRTLGRAVALVENRFTQRPGAVPGSWWFPDVRISAGTPRGTIAVWAHRWGHAVALALTPMPSRAPGAPSHGRDDWNQIDWEQIERDVNRLQVRIAKAATPSRTGAASGSVCLRAGQICWCPASNGRQSQACCTVTARCVPWRVPVRDRTRASANRPTVGRTRRTRDAGRPTAQPAGWRSAPAASGRASTRRART